MSPLAIFIATVFGLAAGTALAVYIDERPKLRERWLGAVSRVFGKVGEPKP